MTIHIVPLVAAAVLIASAQTVARAEGAALARALAVRAAMLALVLSVGLPVVGALLGLTSAEFGPLQVLAAPPGLLVLAPSVTCLVALVAVSLAPLATHPPVIMAKVLQIVGVAAAFLSTPEPVVLVLLWAVSSRLAWSGVRASSSARGRVFAIYHIPSTVMFGAGALLLATGQQTIGALLLVGGITIREAVLGVHSWFTRFVEQVPLGLVVAFAAPQLGVYAQLELLGDGLPIASAHQVAAVGAITAVAAALLGSVQSRPRRSVAYLVMSQTGLVAFGLENHSGIGVTGAVLTWQVLALATSGLIMTLAALEARRGPLSLDRLDGNLMATPKLGVAFLVLGFATVGFPMTLGFVAEDLLVQGSVAEYPWLALALIVATAFNGITVMRMFFAFFTGRPARAGDYDLTRREHVALSVVIVALLVGGLAPRTLLQLEFSSASPTEASTEAGHASGTH